MALLGVVVSIHAWAAVDAMAALQADFKVHVLAASKVVDFTYAKLVPHFLFHLLVVVVNWIGWEGATQGLHASGLVVTSVCCGLFAIIAYVVLRRSFDAAPSPRTSAIAAGLTLAVVMISPVTIFTWPDNLYLGYIGLQVFHSPTQLVLRPIALVLFLCILRIFSDDRRSADAPLIAITTAATALSALAKPTYLPCLLPGVGLLFLYRLARGRAVDWRLVIVGLALPAVALLLWQFSLAYTGAGSGKILFMPFAVVAHHSDWLVPKFFLSLLFPLCAYALYFKEARTTVSVNLGWLVLFFGVSQMYLLAESGRRMWHGNFLWGAQLSLLILVLMTTAFFVERLRDSFATPGGDRSIVKAATVGGAFALHLVSGLYQSYARFTRDITSW